MDDFKKKFFLIIKHNYFSIQVISEDNKSLFNEKFSYENINFENKLNILTKFLDKTIFKIEKKFNIHIKDIYLIIDDENFINIDVSLTKDYKYEPNIMNNISNDLLIIKESVLKSNIDFQLTHMIINKYIIDKKHHFQLPEQVNMNSFFLEVSLICLKTNILINLKKILSFYQISIKKVFDYNYVNSFKIDGVHQISSIANQFTANATAGGTNSTVTTTGTIANNSTANASSAHANVQPTVILNYIIKT